MQPGRVLSINLLESSLGFGEAIRLVRILTGKDRSRMVFAEKLLNYHWSCLFSYQYR